jgi:hypothetical protein
MILLGMLKNNISIYVMGEYLNHAMPCIGPQSHVCIIYSLHGLVFTIFPDNVQA